MLEKEYPGERDRGQVEEIIKGKVKIKRKATPVVKVVQTVGSSVGGSSLHVRGQGGRRDIWHRAQGSGQAHIINRSHKASIPGQKVQKPIVINSQISKPPQHAQNERLFLHLLR